MADPSIVVDGDGRRSASSTAGWRWSGRRTSGSRSNSTVGQEADIGSNDKGFWFWVKDKKEQAIYVCDYENVNASPLAVTMQPDWIMEAMGLREISEREAATINADQGRQAGPTDPDPAPQGPKGETLTKVTVVDETTGEILEHRLYSGAKEKLLASATISQTRRIKIEPTEDDPSGSVVELPRQDQARMGRREVLARHHDGSDHDQPAVPRETAACPLHRAADQRGDPG